MSHRDSQSTETALRDEPRRESERGGAPPPASSADRRPPLGRAVGSASAIPGAMPGHAQTPPAAQATPRAAKADHRSAGEWTSVERAAAFLGFAPVSLRRALEREARKRADGSIIAQWDGVVARKLGRVWRVWLDAKWRNPTAAE